ncbi:hypothetical protein [Burkholderia anthina]|uniref:hypothetical protein n=1 Tax=Burkholderia anthina TaxID=179879 RepID=UPI000A73E55C|nr:hypothetical protein [Burkholderia anthina]
MFEAPHARALFAASRADEAPRMIALLHTSHDLYAKNDDPALKLAIHTPVNGDDEA